MPSIISDGSGELHAGSMLGRYELLMPIAKGGMGNVWAARLRGTRGFRKLVAIKTILRTLENAHLEQMLFQEAMLASQIHHPNVAETFELGEHEGTLYLVMELVSGESLRFILRQAQAHGGVPIPIGVNLVAQVCRGLAAAHDLRDEDGQRVGLVHRDISPPNVLVTDAGTVKIVDFGVATTASSATYGSGEIKGKISYLAPEQLRGERMDARVDVFATGILLYLLTVGQHPFRCASEGATIARILSDVPAAEPSTVVEGYPDALARVVMRALDKDRDARFGSITQLLEALESAWPSAFGPRADEAVAKFVQSVTKERLQERRFTLRVAEEWAETSSSRHSLSSVPAVATSAAPRIHSSRAAWFGVGGALAGVAAAAAVATLHLRMAEAPKQPAAPLPVKAAVVEVGHVGPQPSPAAAPIAAPASAPTPDSAPKVLRSANSRTATKDSSERAELEVSSERDAAAAAAPDRVAVVETSVEAPPSPPPTASPNALPSAPLAPAATVLPAPSKVTSSDVPRVLPSKLGHRRLITNPRAHAVRLPAALAGAGQSFSAALDVCVGTNGEVSKVRIRRSAGPALDPQIVELVSRWRYRPLVEGAGPTSFCYPMNYQVDPE